MIRRDLATVIVPAYNEAASIAALLGELLDGIHSEAYQVIVACNGCRDNTAEIVHNQFPEVLCLEIATPSKTNALNKAEALQPGFPRVYIDADVQISSSAVIRLIDILRAQSAPLVLAPRGIPQTTSSDQMVQWFYAAWQKTVYFVEDGFGSGVYALNRPAREKFSVFPDLISDDGFVRTLGQDVRIQVCEESISRVQAPRSVRDLLAIKIRSKLGKLQLQQNKSRSHTENSISMAKVSTVSRAKFSSTPSALEFLTYSGINAVALFCALWQRNRMVDYRWQRDESTRTTT